MQPLDTEFDLVVIGGGVNGCGVARDAAGRGLKVLLVEKEDLGWATSSASTKLFHGGLRYLEFFEFRLVREALIERETLLKAMPHISWPMRFVLPYNPDLRFADSSTLGKVLRIAMPFLGGRRPAWLTRLGLFVYDHLGGRKILPATKVLNLARHKTGAVLKSGFGKAFEYSDCWVEDSRLVALNARDAADRGAIILTRTVCEGAAREEGRWTVSLRSEVGEAKVAARAIVNAGGPWVADVLTGKLRQNSTESVRLVRGSHIVTKRLFEHDQPYFLQQPDGRIIFAIPYETDFTLIGTTDEDHEGDPANPVCTPEERDYLINAVNLYFDKPISAEDVVWTYSGVRPLYDDGASTATAATRDYVLSLSDPSAGAPVLSCFGGKITTYRRLSEEVVDRITGVLGGAGRAWTAGAPLPGGDFPHDGVEDLIAFLRSEFAFLDDRWARRLARAYGVDAKRMLEGAALEEDLGQRFGWNLTAREVDWLIDHEFARTAADILWRRSKLGLRLSAEEVERLDAYVAGRVARAS